MINLIKKLYRFFIRGPFRKLKLILNNTGNKHKCYVCGNTFGYFSKFGGGTKNIPEFIKNLNCVGSDVDNFGCPYCSAHDRERHLFMFFDQLRLWEKMPYFQILHFAPEINLSKRIEQLNPVKYIKADFYPKNENIQKIDAAYIPYNDETFDFVICNHVLEHIPDYFKAIKEIYRVLKPNGLAILQTPFSKILSQNFQDENFNTDKLRHFFYGQKDHCRIFSEQHLFNDLKNAGFNLEIIKNSDFFDDKTSYYFGINRNEDLIQVVKSGIFA